jgi:signal peptidase I
MIKTILEFVKTIVIAVAIALLITTFFDPTLVKGYSMYPTIQPNNFLIINKIPYMNDEPKFGDIVVFKAQVESLGEQEKDLIKRVIGVAGDTISVTDGIVYRNGVALDEPYIYIGGTPGEMDQVTVEADKLFVMGDNRTVSLDSRDERLGQIPVKDVLGRADLRLFPFTEIGSLQSK